MSFEEDARTFLEEATPKDFASMTKKETQLWMFRLKKQLSMKYEVKEEGYSHDYEVMMTSEDNEENHAEFVIDVKEGEVEINAFVMEDGETKVNEVRKSD